MSSAAPPLFSSDKTISSRQRDVRVLYRRVCILRAMGKTEEADAFFSGKLASVIAAARESQEISESQFEAIFASEEDRIDTAQALAEILVPLLAAATEASAARRDLAASRFPDTSRRMEDDRPADSWAEATPSAAGNNSGPMLPGIADFIDEMLTQDRAPLEGRNLRRPA